MQAWLKYPEHGIDEFIEGEKDEVMAKVNLIRAKFNITDEPVRWIDGGLKVQYSLMPGYNPLTAFTVG